MFVYFRCATWRTWASGCHWPSSIRLTKPTSCTPLPSPSSRVCAPTNGPWRRWGVVCCCVLLQEIEKEKVWQWRWHSPHPHSQLSKSSDHWMADLKTKNLHLKRAERCVVSSRMRILNLHATFFFFPCNRRNHFKCLRVTVTRVVSDDWGFLSLLLLSINAG